MDKLLCPWEPSVYFFFSENIPPLVHYSHLVALLAALSIGLFLFLNNPADITSRLVALFSITFSLWTALDVLLWATNSPSEVMFAWSLQVLLEPLTYVLAFFSFYYFVHRKWPSFNHNLFIAFLFLPLLLLLPTSLTLEGLVLSTCESIEGPLALYYTHIVHIILIVSIVIVGIIQIPKIESVKEKKSSWYFLVGLVTFLLAFSSGNVIGSLTEDWTVSQYGLLGMPIFAGFIAYSVVRFRAFKAKVVVAQILVFVLGASVISLAALENISNVRIVSILTFVLVCVLGYVLIKSVRKEILMRSKFEELNHRLSLANKRLQDLDKQKSEFLSIASHQLRSPLTAIRGYASLLLDGTYGEVGVQFKEPLSRIHESSKLMAVAIEDYLNVSRIEAGNMKYSMTDFNLSDQVDYVCDDLRPEAMRKGLSLIYRTHISGRGLVHADIGKVVQIVQNLINNAIKYTTQGTVRVLVRDDVARNKIYVEISDTGIGMDKDEQEMIFQKFERAKNANSVNVHGTGLGLFVALKMAEAMGGTITVHSDGEGEGSRFSLELPLVL